MLAQKSVNLAENVADAEVEGAAEDVNVGYYDEVEFAQKDGERATV